MDIRTLHPDDRRLIVFALRVAAVRRIDESDRKRSAELAELIEKGE